jgi:16S rRNA (guanine(966)-N(2))-methyltransferase RsmD
MRIIAGQFKGRRLAGPPATGVRPTSDRLRETLFNVIGPSIAGVRVLDGYAGTGAIGLEALSRGAEHVTFVENDVRAIRIIERNIAVCGAGEVTVVLRGAFPGLRRRAPRHVRVDLAVLDPPYDASDLDAIVNEGAAWLVPTGRLVLEHSRRRESPERAGTLVRRRVLIAGDSALSFYGVESAD